MHKVLTADALRAELERQGIMTSAQIQRHFGKTQATVSRLLQTLEDELIVIGAARSTRYALAEPIGRFSAVQPIMWVDSFGALHRIGTLNFLAQSRIHVEADGVDMLFAPSPDAALPWFLSGLKAQGFLGRMLAKKLAAEGVSGDPDRWDTRTSLIAALHTYDAPSAFLLGTQGVDNVLPVIPSHNPEAFLDALAADIANTLPVGSSAGGEQPKFLASNTAGESFVVKFSPPRGTPFGERWHDLLCAESISAQVLERAGIAAAQATVIQTPTRSYLLSRRFDRTPQGGRKPVVSIGAAHQGLLKTPFQNWATTAQELHQLKRLSATDAETVNDVLQFGRLIGNTDMHSGNLALYMTGENLKILLNAPFSLAPVYDMLPMRWRPDTINGALEYAPFAVDTTLARAPILAAAREFWSMVSQDERISEGLRGVAKRMMEIIPPPHPTPVKPPIYPEF